MSPSRSWLMVELQWVRCRITAVMLVLAKDWGCEVLASMGPLSDNSGYVGRQEVHRQRALAVLQWVRCRITAVMAGDPRQPARRHRASMGPLSDNSGYD